MISMNLKIIDKKDEPLFSRTKITSEVHFDASTPSSKDVKEKIKSLLKVNENLLIIKNIHTYFGIKKAGVLAYLYKNEKDMDSIETTPKKEESKGADISPEKPTENKDGKKEEKS